MCSIKYKILKLFYELMNKNTEQEVKTVEKVKNRTEYPGVYRIL